MKLKLIYFQIGGNNRFCKNGWLRSLIISHPLSRLGGIARRTQKNTDILAPRPGFAQSYDPAGLRSHNSHRFAKLIKPLPERDDGFAWKS